MKNFRFSTLSIMLYIFGNFRLKYVGIKKIKQSYSQSVTQHFYRYNPRVFAFSV